MVQMETQLQSIFEEVVKTEIIEEAFPGMFMDTPEDEKTKLISCLGAFRQFWGGLSQESHEQCIQWIVKFIHGQHSPKRISFLYDCLAMAVETGLLPPRMVCESLINSDTLEWERTQLWALTFKLVRKIIGGVDYKGVRDLLKVILEKTLTIPNTVSSAVVQQLLAAREVIAYILERNACLLPAYFAVTEIRKLYPEGKLPHWLLGNLVSDFVDTFRPTARINSICGRCSLLPVVNNSGAICNSWKLDPATLRFPLKGLLPYDKDLFEPQTALLRYVLEQPYSRDMVCNMLGLNKQTLNIAQHKQRCPVLEDQLVDLVVYAMERSETEEKFDDGGTSQLLWQHLSSQLIFFVLFQFASFPHMVLSLHQKLAGRGLIKGRDHLMWVLLQFISGSIQKNALADFLPVMKLFDLLYPEKEFIPVPDINKPQSTHAFAMTCIWIHLNRKAQNDNSKLQIPIPHSLKLHHDLIHSIATRVIKLAHAKSSVALAPALVETYSRLLVYMEIESLGIKGFISQLLPTVFKSHAWGILHTLLEMFSYRMHHIQPHYRVQLLSHLHTLAAVAQTNQNQLHLCVESTALRLITALGSSEVQPQFTRFLSDPKTVLSAESEELNRALILTLARATHVTDFFTGSDSIQGTWCKDILQTIMSFTPHNWASHTLSCFPGPLQAFFKQNNVPQESRFNLKKNVEEEYRKWKSMTNENDIITHFSAQRSPPLFLCLLWKMLLETDHINQIGYRVLERIGARALVVHVRTFADFLVYEFSTSAGGQQLNKCIEILNDMVWKYNIVTLDRLILCLAMRSHEGNEAQVCYFIIQLLLLKPNDFRNRVSDFVKENSPEHWLQNDWHTKHMNYHKKYPEKLYFEGLAEQVDPPVPIQSPYLPIYFGNVCLRFLPVFDIVIHRFLELLPVSKSLETLLDHLGGLYKFHDRPVTYLYNTLHYYEMHLRNRESLKRKLVHAIIGSLKDNRPQGWCLSDTYLKCAMNAREDNPWVPDDSYYCKLIGRLVDTMAGKSPGPFPNCDWRFNEFPNPAAHALHVTCVELMALAVSGQDVGNALLNVVLKSQPLVPRENITAWMNAIGLIITALPEPYWIVLHDRIVSVISSPSLTSETEWVGYPFRLFDFTACHQSYSEMSCSYTLALAHAVWHHSSIGQLSLIPKFLTEVLLPIVKTEFQLLYVYHLVGPFLQRFQQERTRCMIEIGVAFYDMLLNVDQCSTHLNYMDPICDFLYHMKYMFTGDSVKEQVEKIICNLKPALKLRLRFITHISKMEPAAVPPQAINSGSPAPQSNQVPVSLPVTQ
ncbi:mediator of RNA polymerase II transcription subunit 23 isoform X4 [Sagmatias obliquidens]|uniref:Mediator of RNA polymerase II transcription subunit 23 n=1 Tax=Tursiops truncatus TaxID=9739 RepID=A0A2U4CP26_TURTR|nr:mediator of RNA polymerase II transcription subunit 23 isoform X4 [Tursiops truncatus]XP_026942126.1 mediator of RNA polymerase II transcription subunit 23 isoform X4 [Lagenorhynchus obliquidens]XP_030709299.1 mediator of RNA polymerase II transcription subunit 23 isoform X4 [Globicephala melas]